VAQANLAGYVVYRDHADAAGQVAVLGDTSTWVDYAVGPEQWHAYWVQAYDFAGRRSGLSPMLTVALPVGPASAVPLWRYWNSQIQDHFYTYERNDPGFAAFHYYLEGTEGRVLTYGASQTLPFNRYWNAARGDHFYTVEPGDYGDWKYERAEGWIFPATRPVLGTVPLWRYWNKGAGDHFYTVTRNDPGYMAFGYYLERIEGYVYP
jgi:hypothetical protein